MGFSLLNKLIAKVIHKLKSRARARAILKKNKEEQTQPVRDGKRDGSEKTAKNTHPIPGNKCQATRLHPVKVSFTNKSTYEQQQQNQSFLPGDSL